MSRIITDVARIMAQSRDYDELLHYWQAWHEAVGPPLKNKYIRYVQLANQAAKLNGENYSYFLILGILSKIKH